MAKQIIYGYHAIEETLKGKGIKGTLFISREAKAGKKQGRLEQLRELAGQKKVGVVLTSNRELDTYTDRENHRGILLLVEQYTEQASHAVDLKDFLASLSNAKALVLILDQITDPHNYGAILRSADMFAVDLVILPERKSVKETEAVRSTSAGAHVYVPVTQVTNLAQAIERLKAAGFWIYGAELKGKPIHQTDLRGRVAIVLGSEGKGIRPLLLAGTDEQIAIPTAGHIDSLNVSVAAGIIMYEVRRQQSFFEDTGSTGSL